MLVSNVGEEMRNDYNAIKQKFELFIADWQTGKIDRLPELVKKDVRAYFSIVNNEQPIGLETAGVKSEPDGAQHSIFGVKDFILDTPKTDKVEYQICNYVCRMNGNIAQQAAEIACIASNMDGKYFKYVAIFCNTWSKEKEGWLINEIHMDLKHEDSPLLNEFAKVGYFEEPLAVLTSSVHLPCIFPELDSPYFKIRNAEDVLSEEEKVMDCFNRFNYGIDWIVFKDVKDMLADDFRNEEKHHYIAYTKFARQRYRYSSNAYTFKSLKIDEDKAYAIVESIVPKYIQKSVNFVKRTNCWQILSIEELGE